MPTTQHEFNSMIDKIWKDIHMSEHAADPRKSPVIAEEVKHDEEYEPEGIQALVRQREIELNAHVRIRAAEIASVIPFNASEPVSDELIKARFNTVYSWIMQDTSSAD
jgi:hypothetical protein